MIAYGETVEIDGEFRDPDTDALTNPSAVRLYLRRVGEDWVSYTYGVDAQLVLISTGLYRFYLYSAPASSVWQYRWEADDGPVTTKDISSFSIGLDETPALETTTPDNSGYGYGYTLPDDLVHKIWIKADAGHDIETSYQIMGRNIYTRDNPVVLEYVALDDDSGNPENWSASFLEAVAAYLALLVSPELVVRVNGKGDAKIDAGQVRQKMEQVFRMKLSDAKMRDAMQQQTLRVPAGRFVRARGGGSRSWAR